MRKLTTQVSHVLPVSDDGGSTAEIVRVIGGPAVGDIRSRCLRLADDRDQEVGGSVCVWGGARAGVLCFVVCCGCACLMLCAVCCGIKREKKGGQRQEKKTETGECLHAG